MLASSVVAQPTADTQADFRDRLVFGSSFALDRQLASLEQMRDAGRWREASQLVQQILADSPDAVVEAEPHRYLGICEWLHGELATWPSEGIDVYRDLVDPSAMGRYEAALMSRDMAGMRSILDTEFGSSVYDDACWQLAHWAWEDGDLAAAECYWQRLLSRDEIISANSDIRLAQFADREFAPELILSRLALCRVFLRDRDEAELAVAAYADRFPTASGTLAGIDGPFAETLNFILRERGEWQAPSDRNETIHLQELAWSRPLTPVEIETPLATALDSPSSPRHALLIDGNSLIVLSPYQIQILDASTGNARWPTGRSDDDGIVYSDPTVEAGIPTLPWMGVPVASGITENGFVYASIGWPVLVHGEDEVRDLTSRIVCIDVDRGEGLVSWIADDDVLPDNWRFCGEPAIVEDRLLVPTTTTVGPIAIGLAALDAGDGSLEWHREICGITDSRSARSHVFGRHQLCISQGDVIWSTPFGCLLKIDGSTGRVRWAIAYASDGAIHEDKATHQKPAVGNGVVFVPSPSSGTVLAVDETHGVIHWTTSHIAGSNQILGVCHGVVVVGGDAAWGLDSSTGQRLWKCGFDDPSGAPCGSGMLAGGTAWWTTRDALLGTDVTTGALVDRVEINAAWNLHGGNLVPSADHLLLLEQGRVSAFQIRRVTAAPR